MTVANLFYASVHNGSISPRGKAYHFLRPRVGGVTVFLLSFFLMAASQFARPEPALAASAPPVIIKAFGAASIPLNGTTSLSFTIQNNNSTTALSGVGFSDTLPAGLLVSTPNGLSGSCGGGTITAAAGTGAISLSGATISPSSSCTFSVNLTGTSAGLKNNTTGNVTSTEGGTGGTASASIKVEAPPAIAIAFNPTTITPNSTTSLTYTITNPSNNVDALTGVAFANTLPAGLTVSNASATICGGTVTLAAPRSVSISGATISASSQCVFSITVTGTATGQYTNTTGNVTSTNGGTGNTASAALTVGQADLSVTISAPAIVTVLSDLTYTITVTNTGPTLAQNVTVSDTLPTNLGFVSTSYAGLGTWQTVSPAVGSGGTVSFTKSSFDVGETVVFQVTVQVGTGATNSSIISNSATVSSSFLDPNMSNNTSTSASTVLYPVQILQPGISYGPTLTAACSSATSPNTILAWNRVFAEILTLNQGKTLTFKGGYDTAFSTNGGMTTVSAPLTVVNGTLTVDQFIVQ